MNKCMDTTMLPVTQTWQKQIYKCIFLLKTNVYKSNLILLRAIIECQNEQHQFECKVTDHE